MQRLLRRAEEDELPLRGVPVQGLLEQLADRLCGDGVGVPRAAETAGRRVAHEHVTVAAHHHHAVVHRVQGCGEPIEVDAQVLGVGLERGDHRVDLLGGCRIGLTAARLGQRPDATLEPPRARRARRRAARARR